MQKATVLKVVKTVLVWLPTLFLAFVFVSQGSAKFSDTSGWARAFNHWGYPEWFRYTIGFAELLAAALLLIPRAAPMGASLIIALMLGGIGTHVAAGDAHVWRSEAGPILFATFILFMRRAELRRAVGASPRWWGGVGVPSGGRVT
jgi:uncharacterized membrane protein YphA (DoxX/SURF4 family)